MGDLAGLRPLAVLSAVVVPALLAGGCGGEDSAGGATSGVSKEELKQEKQKAFVRGEQRGYDEGYAAAQSDARNRVSTARRAGFQQGVNYVLGSFNAEPGESYAVSFKDSARGLYIKNWLHMKPGRTYECPPNTSYCDSESTTGTDPGRIDELPDCDPSYPDQCLDPTAIDYDCSSGGGDGPEYVTGPLEVLPPDPFDLDRDGNGIGCEYG